MIRNIILDIGRVLVAWEPEEAMQKLGMSEEDIREVSDVLFSQGAWNEVDRGVMTDEELLRFFIEKAPKQEENIKLFWENVGTAIRQFEYSLPWIRALKKSGYHVYILSNYGSHTYEATKENGLSFLSEIEGIQFSYQVKMIKPDLEIYQDLLQRFSLIPEECIFIDDLVANIEGAKKAGINGIVFKGFEETREALKEYGVEFHM